MTEPDEPESIRKARRDVELAEKRLAELLSGKCQYCKGPIPVGYNTCGPCANDHSP